MTVPVTVTCFCVSNADALWCASTGAARPSVTNAANVNRAIVFMVGLFILPAAASASASLFKSSRMRCGQPSLLVPCRRRKVGRHTVVQRELHTESRVLSQHVGAHLRGGLRSCDVRVPVCNVLLHELDGAHVPGGAWSLMAGNDHRGPERGNLVDRLRPVFAGGVARHTEVNMV